MRIYNNLVNYKMKDFLMNLKLEKLIAVVREPSFERGLEITNSLLEIGVKNIEITLTTPNAFKIVEALIINDKNILLELVVYLQKMNY